jgi:hypothetical protein
MATRVLDLVLLFFTMLLIGVLLPVKAHAGGSLSREEFLERIQDSEIRAFVEGNFDLEEDARAARIGRQDPARAGERVAPFEILARSRAGAQRVVVHVEGDVSILSCAGSVHYASDCE